MPPITFLRRAMVVPILIGTLKAVTLQVAEDTFSNPPRSNTSQARLLPASGKSGKLAVSSKQAAFIRFEVGLVSGDIPADEVDRALLVIYFTKITKAGQIQLRPLSHDWTESSPSIVAAPSVDVSPIATIPPESVIANQFAIVDVTEQVRAWLRTPSTDFGFALTGDAAANVQIGAKEGPGTGYPALLQIERTRVIGNDRLSSGIDVSKVGDGTVNNVELSYLNGVKSVIQLQIDQLGTALDALALTERDRINGNDRLSSGIDASKVGDGTVNNIELSYLHGTKSVLQTQIDQLGTGLDAVNSGLTDKVSKSGDTMSGPLRLPADGVKIGETQLVAAAGKVGIGTDTPTAALDVRGDVKLGAAGELQATGGDEPLRIVRGILANQNGNLTLVSGSGFSFSKLAQSTTDFEITFSRAFSGPPTVMIQQEVTPSATSSLGSIPLRAVDASRIEVRYLGAPTYSGIRIHVIAIGPR